MMRQKSLLTQEQKADSLAILGILNKMQGTLVRFGRTKKITERFFGILVGCKYEIILRRGGGFELNIKYKNEFNWHLPTIRNMLNDYISCISNHITNGTHNLKHRRQALEIPRTKVPNGSTDLELYIAARWIKFGDFLPNAVKLLTPGITRAWIDKWITQNDTDYKSLCEYGLQVEKNKFVFQNYTYSLPHIDNIQSLSRKRKIIHQEHTIQKKQCLHINTNLPPIETISKHIYNTIRVDEHTISYNDLFSNDSKFSRQRTRFQPELETAISYNDSKFSRQRTRFQQEYSISQYMYPVESSTLDSFTDERSITNLNKNCAKSSVKKLSTSYVVESEEVLETGNISDFSTSRHNYKDTKYINTNVGIENSLLDELHIHKTHMLLTGDCDISKNYQHFDKQTNEVSSNFMEKQEPSIFELLFSEKNRTI